MFTSLHIKFTHFTVYTLHLINTLHPINTLHLTHLSVNILLKYHFQIENFRIEEDARRSNVEEGTREELKDIATDQKDPAKRYKFS